LNIWATWCKPCLEEIPTLHEVQRNFKKGDVQYLSLSIDKDSVALSKFLDSKHFNYKDITFENLAFRKSILNTLEGKNPDKHILTQTVPITYVIKNRKVIRKFEGGIEKERLENSLNEI
jgi:thiol-disulfide isomerase/thioredoxin